MRKLAAGWTYGERRRLVKKKSAFAVQNAQDGNYIGIESEKCKRQRMENGLCKYVSKLLQNKFRKII